MLEFNISMGQVFLGNNYDSGHELNDDEEIVKRLYTSYLDRDENNIKQWFDYASFFLDNQQKKEIYEKIIKEKKSALAFTWYNLATIYIQEENISEAPKIFTARRDSSIWWWQGCISKLNRRP